MIDLPTLDRRVKEAHAGVASALDELDRLKPEERPDFTSDAFGARRDVAGQSTFVALRELAPVAFEVPLRDGLLRWVHELLQTRVAWDLLIDEANARHLPDPSLPRNATGIARTFEEARRALLVATHPVAIDGALERLAVLAVPVVAVRSELRARRQEVASRLGIGPATLATDGKDIAALATRVLDATEPLAAELHRRTSKSDEAGSVAARSIASGFAHDAVHGWPAHLTARWLEDVFQTIAPRTPNDVVLPEALGGASFLRAAWTWGRALRLGSIPRSLPFGLARDPSPVEAFAYGALLATAVAGPVFAKRKLALSAKVAEAQARPLARARFLALRRQAASIVGIDEGLSARLHGEPLPASLRALGTFSGNDRVDAPARLLGLLRGDRLARSLVDHHDVDWFDNPRAASYLAAVAAGPAWTPMTEDEDAGIAVLVKGFEERLG